MKIIILRSIWILASLTLICIVIMHIDDREVHEVEKNTLSERTMRSRNDAERQGSKPVEVLLPEDVQALLPGPVTAKDLRALDPIDTGRMLPAQGMFSRATTIVFLTLGEIDRSQLRELNEVIVDVARIQFLKGADRGDALRSFSVEREVPDRRLQYGHNPWISAEVELGDSFIVSSDTDDVALVDQLQDPAQVIPVEKDNIDDVLRELTFLSKFDELPIRQQLALSGLSEYIENDGVIGRPLGDHIGSLYNLNPRSVRPDLLSIVEQLESKNFSDQGVEYLLSHLRSLNWGVSQDLLGSAVLIGLKGLNSINGHSSGPDSFSLAEYCPAIINLIEQDRGIVQTLMKRRSFAVQHENLQHKVQEWSIDTDTAEHALLSVNALLDVLGELQ